MVFRHFGNKQQNYYMYAKELITAAIPGFLKRYRISFNIKNIWEEKKVEIL